MKPIKWFHTGERLFSPFYRRETPRYFVFYDKHWNRWRFTDLLWPEPLSPSPQEFGFCWKEAVRGE